jgi:hypothetical protein
LVPGGVIVTRPLVGEILPDDDALDVPADRPQAEVTSAHTAATAITVQQLRLWSTLYSLTRAP